MRFTLFTVTLLASQSLSAIDAYRFDVLLPVTEKYSTKHGPRTLRTAFKGIVENSAFLSSHTPQLVPSDETTTYVNNNSNHNSCFAPSFGDDAKVTLSAQYGPGTLNYKLSLMGEDTTLEDFGWICLKFLEDQDRFDDTLGMRNVSDLVQNHLKQNVPPPRIGYDAAIYKDRNGAARIFRNEKSRISNKFNQFTGSHPEPETSLLQELKENGFIVIDTDVLTSARANSLLSDFLVDKTNQSAQVRRDTVKFMDHEECLECGLKEQYDVLMSIVPYLNDHFDFQVLEGEPIAPATQTNPLVNPSHIQVAEYGNGDYYVAHSDNSFCEDTGIRANHRYYTCILYCNDNWTPEDGGALRIYPGRPDPNGISLDSDDTKTWADAVDVNPVNGRMILFDSTMVHSVEPVHSNKKRRALTLWIPRPIEGGIRE